jgi:hypothetical protein
MAGSWAMVNRNRYLSGSQKLVQARMYAQGATLAALMTSFGLEGADAAKGQGRWETIKVLDPNDPEHKHLIEKRIHHESYPGEDQWRGTSEPFFTRIYGLDCTTIAGYRHEVLCRGTGRTIIMQEKNIRRGINGDADLHTEMIEAEEERIKERDAAKTARQQAQKVKDKETPAKTKSDS